MWKDIKGLEGLYAVNKFGEVKNIKTEKIIKGDVNSAGYRRVKLSNNGKTKRFFVHKIVAQTFLIQKEPDLIVNHKDGNKMNNNVENLEFISRTENNIHANKIGLTKSKYSGLFNVEFLDGTIKQYDSYRVCSRDIGVNHRSLMNWLKGLSIPSIKKLEEYGIKKLYCLN